jgi:predicted O-methyltransferase YrrM
MAPDGVATETDVSALIASLVGALKPDLVVETGAYLGHTTREIGARLAIEGRGRLIALEIAADRAACAAQRCQAFPVEVIAGDSLAWTPPPRARIDLLFLDSEYETRLKECRRFKPWASPRCVIVAHDTVIANYRKGLEQLAVEGITTPWVHLPTPRGLSLARYRP